MVLNSLSFCLSVKLLMEKAMAPHSSTLAWKIPAVHGVTKGRTRLSDFTFTFHFPALEKEMATHSSILAWKIPWGREESDTTERLPFHFSLSCTGEGNGNSLQCSCLKNPRDGSKSFFTGNLVGLYCLLWILSCIVQIFLARSRPSFPQLLRGYQMIAHSCLPLASSL